MDRPRLLSRLRRSPWLPIAVAALATTLAACELIVGELAPVACGPDSDCDPLNIRDGIALTACPRWFCDQTTHACVNASVDADHDGHSDPSCGGDDCNDHDPTIHPGNMTSAAAPETCNGADDDCNGIIDDTAVVKPTPGQVVAAMSPSNASFSPGVADDSLVTFVNGSGNLQGRDLPAVGAPITITALTNNHSTGVSSDLDSLLHIGVTTTSDVAMHSQCMVWQAAGKPCTADSPDCFVDHGTCLGPDAGIMAGHCVCSSGTCTTGTGFDPGMLCRHSQGDGDGGTIQVYSDTACTQQQFCVRGFCSPPDHSDMAPGDCRFVEAASDQVTPANVVLAAIDVLGCSSGSLRLLAATPDLMTVEELGPELRSNVYAGVDVTPATQFDAGLPPLPDGGTPLSAERCTGRSRADQIYGASRPSVVALHGTGAAGTPPQALVAYLARPQIVPAPACGTTTAAPVQVIGAFLEETSGGGPHPAYTVSGSGGGVPQQLGHTAGGSPVGLATIGGTGYAVAFSDSDMGGNIGVFVVPPAPAPERFDPAAPVPTNPDAGSQFYHPFYLRHSDPLATPATAIVHIPAGAMADHVVVSVGAATPTGYQIGVAWQEGCDAAAVVKFSIVDYHTTGASTASAPIAISDSSFHAAQSPAILYVADGFVTTQYHAGGDGGTAATPSTDGGWLIAFAAMGPGTGRREWVARVSELDGRLLETPMDASDATAASPFASAAGMYPTTVHGRAAIGYQDTMAGEIGGGTLLCLPPPDAGM